jgi:hypothetical protein
MKDLFQDHQSYIGHMSGIYESLQNVIYFHPYGAFKTKRINCMAIESFYLTITQISMKELIK